MNKKILMGLLLTMLLALTSCDPKMMPVNQLRNLSENTELKGDTYSLKDWNKAKNKYVKINKKLLKHRSEYSAEELMEISQLETQCITGFGKGIASSSARSVAGMGAGVMGVIEEIKALIEEFKKKKE